MYLIVNGEHVKIGRSSRLGKRLSHLQVGAAVKLDLVHSWTLAARDAPAMESGLHRLFRWARSSGEWHRAEPSDIRSVGDVLLSGDRARAERLAQMLEIIYRLREERDRAHRHHAYSRTPRQRLERAREQLLADRLDLRLYKAEAYARRLGRHADGGWHILDYTAEEWARLRPTYEAEIRDSEDALAEEVAKERQQQRRLRIIERREEQYRRACRGDHRPVKSRPLNVFAPAAATAKATAGRKVILAAYKAARGIT